MKKTLLTIFSAMSAMVGFSQQTPSPQWLTNQNSNFPIPSAGIRYLDVVSANDVWATGYDGTTGNVGRAYCWVTRTNDGGANWSVNPVWSGTNAIVGDTNTYVISNIDGISGTTAWVGAYKKPGQEGGIFKTTDGGATWVDMTAAGMYTNATSFCNYVFFLTPNVGISAGDPNPGTGNEHEIWRTTDGGTTWNLVPGANIPNPLSGEFGYTSVYEKVGSTHAWLGTNRGRVYYTTDAGVTWSVTTVKAGSNPVNDVAFYDANNGLAQVTVGTSTIIEVYNTNDGGATWTLLPNAGVDPNYGRNDICAIPGTSWFASCGAGAGNYLLSFSSDNGATWNDWGSVNIQYLAIDFADAQSGWAGTFSDQTNAALDGFYKYSGPSLLQSPTANFSFTSPTLCVGLEILPNNNSTGNPMPTYTWSSNPAAAFSSTSATTPTISFTTPGIYTITLVASNSSSTSVISQTVDVSLCTGLVDGSLNSFNFFVYPNPSNANFNVTLPYANSPYAFTVTNVLGAVVYSDKAVVNNGNHVLNMANYNKGVYFLTIENNGIKTTKKIILD